MSKIGIYLPLSKEKIPTRELSARLKNSLLDSVITWFTKEAS
ncbi:5843_t:CDS:2 [Ambispora leptoticha]|uniref:5843_t:CDS:1 n=1 Tax=Ambispora leptoticha TaxID=144679 RepID=A0A9N9ABG5_9GLOM|nr:5843_t:CDS:2 [Ambispora leptoticha]